MPKKPTTKKTIATKRVSKPVKKTAYKTIAKKPVVKKPVARKVMAKKPVAKKTTTKETISKKSAIKTPVVKRTVTKKPLVRIINSKKINQKKINKQGLLFVGLGVVAAILLGVFILPNVLKSFTKDKPVLGAVNVANLKIKGAWYDEDVHIAPGATSWKAKINLIMDANTVTPTTFFLVQGNIKSQINFLYDSKTGIYTSKSLASVSSASQPTIVAARGVVVAHENGSSGRLGDYDFGPEQKIGFNQATIVNPVFSGGNVYVVNTGKIMFSVSGAKQGYYKVECTTAPKEAWLISYADYNASQHKDFIKVVNAPATTPGTLQTDEAKQIFKTGQTCTIHGYVWSSFAQRNIRTKKFPIDIPGNNAKITYAKWVEASGGKAKIKFMSDTTQDWYQLSCNDNNGKLIDGTSIKLPNTYNPKNTYRYSDQKYTYTNRKCFISGVRWNGVKNVWGDAIAIAQPDTAPAPKPAPAPAPTFTVNTGKITYAKWVEASDGKAKIKFGTDTAQDWYQLSCNDNNGKLIDGTSIKIPNTYNSKDTYRYSDQKYTYTNRKCFISGVKWNGVKNVWGDAIVIAQPDVPAPAPAPAPAPTPVATAPKTDSTAVAKKLATLTTNLLKAVTNSLLKLLTSKK